MIQLGLGTVQLGLPYGNKVGRPLMPKEEAFAILDEAFTFGIYFLDTAVGYGESESRIGEFLRSKSVSFQISTKIPATKKETWSNTDSYRDFLRDAIGGSLDRLGLPKLRLLQFHQCDEEFLLAQSVRECMRELLESGKCEKIGISVYTPEQAKLACTLEEVTCLQVPVNLLDVRFLSPSLIDLYKERSIFLIARSVFLQGVLHSAAPIPPVARHMELREIRARLVKLFSGCSLEEAGIRFVFGNLKNVLDIALIGVDSAADLRQNLAIFRSEIEEIPEDILRELILMRQEAEQTGLLNPAQWNS